MLKWRTDVFTLPPRVQGIPTASWQRFWNATVSRSAISHIGSPFISVRGANSAKLRQQGPEDTKSNSVKQPTQIRKLSCSGVPTAFVPAGVLQGLALRHLSSKGPR